MPKKVAAAPSPHMLSRKALAQRVGLSWTTITRLLEQKAFPQPVQLSVGRIAWRSEEIESWLASRPLARVKEDA
jgi:predicted DNA-binding transcriptional regulator AlpA